MTLFQFKTILRKMSLLSAEDVFTMITSEKRVHNEETQLYLEVG